MSNDMDALVAELKATQQERREAEARLADPEGYERDLRDQQEQVERLRRVWGGWAAAPEADVPTARQILRKILVGRIYVRPVGPRAPGRSPKSAGTMAPCGVAWAARRTSGPAYGPRSDDFCQLMLYLLAEPAEAPDPSRRESLFGLCMERARVIAGDSDAEGWDQAGGVSSGPPCQTVV